MLLFKYDTTKMAHVTNSHSFHSVSQDLQNQTEIQSFYLHPYLFENFYSCFTISKLVWFLSKCRILSDA